VSTQIATFTGLIVFAVSAGAGAQTPASATSDASPLEDTGCVNRDAARTSELFAHATAAWEQGDTASAVAALSEAHAVSKCSAFLFVLGEMLSQSPNECEARVWYERYLNDNIAVQKRAEATARIAELETRCPAPPKAADETPAPPAAPVPTRPPVAPIEAKPSRNYFTPARMVGFASLGVGALLGTGAVYFAVRAHNASRDYEALWTSVARDPAQVPNWQEQRRDLEDRGTSSATTARVLGGAAGALAIGGALLLLFNPPNGTRHDVALVTTPSAIVARYGFGF
jgi:hypothetical protein